MNIVKNYLTALAFVFAIGAVFAFKPAEATTGQIPVEVKNTILGTCPAGFADDKCTQTSGTLCHVIGGFFEVVPDGQSCDQPSLYRP